MKKRLQVTLPQGWSDYSEENEGGPTYLRDASENPGPLQISWAEHTGGEMPQPTTDDLIQMGRELGRSQNFGEPIESSGDTCAFGKVGTVVFRSHEHRIQIWHLSNGRDFINVTHIGPRDHNPDEIREAQEIVRALNLAEAKPKWKFW